MKIVHICGTFTEKLGYQENYLTKYHSKMGNHVTVITSRWVYDDTGSLTLQTSGPFQYVNDDGVRVVRLPILFGASFHFRLHTLRGFHRMLKQEAPDILFVHGCQFLDVHVIARYAKRHPNVRIYVDNHADFSNSATNFLSKSVLHGMIWRGCAHRIEPYTRKFYGVLPARVDFLEDVYGLSPAQCELLVMGADDEQVIRAKQAGARRQIREQHHISENDFLVVTGGKIDQWKTQTLLLMQAVRNISDVRVRLLVFGSVTPELKAQVEALSDGERVRYIGWIRAEESYDYFEAADLVVFPGRHSVLWEQAAGQGVPMLVKDWPGTHHVDLGGNVRFLTQDSAEEIRQALEWLMKHPECYEEMKNVATERGIKAFSYRDIAGRAIECDGETE